MVAIEARGAKTPLFLVHGAEGNVLLYRSLALQLSENQPVYGLQSKGLSGNEDFFETFEEMAAHYVEEIKKIQPNGPYCLGGYCLGGTIALEMAQQLKARGDDVALVAMFETYNADPISARQSRWPGLLHFFENTMYHFANLLLIPSGRRRQFINEKLRIASERLRVRLDAWAHVFRRNRRPELWTAHAHLMIKKANDRAQAKYRPGPYSGRVVLFRPKKYFLGLTDPQFGWGDIVHPNLEVRSVPFYPKGMLVEPFVRTLARELDHCLSANIESTALTHPAESLRN